MPGRTFNNGNYRFGYNGMEQDVELKGNGNSYTTEFRQYDPRLGRWMSLDPMMVNYPSMSPYCAFNNNPILFVDPLGLEATNKDGNGEGPKTHSLKSGETLSHLSKKYNVTVEDLYQWNPGTREREKNLQIGEKIIVENPGTVKSEPGLTIGSSGTVGTGQDSKSSKNGVAQSDWLDSAAEDYIGAQDSHIFSYLEKRLMEVAWNTEEVHKMMRHWKENGLSGKQTYNYDTQGLVNIMKGEQSVKNLISGIEKEFISEMKENKGDYTAVNLTKLSQPSFGLSTPTLLTLIGGTQKTTVKISAIEIDYKTRKYKATLVMSLYDDFGVSEDDVTKYFGSNATLKQKAIGQVMRGPLIMFWVLQHQRGYAPLINVYKFEISVDGTF